MQHVNGKPALLISIDEELHDVRRVLKNGEEDDLRGALEMMIRRVEEMKGLFVERERITNNEKVKEKEVLAAKQREIEALQHELSEKDVELGVTRSNLRMVSANNEMLEEALRGGGGGLGWGHRRGESAESSQSQQTAPALKEDSRFFNKFRFASRPGTPSSSLSRSPSLHYAASTPNLTLSSDDESSDREKEYLAAKQENEKRLQDLRDALEKEKHARSSLEAELESLSQALFEEANKMVATERRKRAETEEELRETKDEREALRSALRVVEGENVRMRYTSTESLPSLSLSRKSSSSSMLATKSRPSSFSSMTSTILMPRPRSRSPSPTLDPLSSIEPSLVQTAFVVPASSSGSESGYASATEDNTEDELSSAVPTPAAHHRTSSAPWEDDEPSPWADLPGSPPPLKGN